MTLLLSGKVSSNNKSEANRCSNSPVINLIVDQDLSREILSMRSVNERDIIKIGRMGERKILVVERKGGDRKRHGSEIGESEANARNSIHWPLYRHKVERSRKKLLRQEMKFLPLSSKRKFLTCLSSVESSLLVCRTSEGSSEARQENRRKEKVPTDRVMLFDTFKGYQGKIFRSRVAMIMLLGLFILASIPLLEYPAFVR